MNKTETVSSILENIGSIFCVSYCRYSHEPVPEGKDENWLWEDEQSPCNRCPINYL